MPTTTGGASEPEVAVRQFFEIDSQTIAGIIAGADSGVQPLDALVRDLAASNARQWTLEDVSRSDAPDEEVAESKREIDRCNANRTRRIADLDELLRILVADPEAPAVTESPGSVIDRLTILTIRKGVLTRQTADADQEIARAFDLVRVQHETLLSALDQVLIDLKSGARTYLGTPIMKVYRGQVPEVP